MLIWAKFAGPEVKEEWICLPEVQSKRSAFFLFLVFFFFLCFFFKRVSAKWKAVERTHASTRVTWNRLFGYTDQMRRTNRQVVNAVDMQWNGGQHAKEQWPSKRRNKAKWNERRWNYWAIGRRWTRDKEGDWSESKNSIMNLVDSNCGLPKCTKAAKGKIHKTNRATTKWNRKEDRKAKMIMVMTVNPIKMNRSSNGTKGVGNVDRKNKRTVLN